MGKIVHILGQESVKEAIISIGQELIRRADDITNDIERVRTITINAVLTPDEIVNFDVTKNYTTIFNDEGE